MRKIIFIISLFILCIGVCCINAYPDNDLWARLIAGAHIVEKLSILKYDIVSYTQTHPWYDHEWGASIFFYLALKYFGDAGLIILKGLLTALTLFMCFKTIELRKPKSTIPYNILYFAIMLFVIIKDLGAITRCLLFTTFFFTTFLYILEAARIGNKKKLILLPFLIIIWSNIHGGCLSGIGLIGLYMVGEFLNKKPFKEYLYSLLGCLVALFINPYGIEYVKFLFYAGTMNRELITEWQSSFSLNNLTNHIRFKVYLFAMLLFEIIHIIKNKINYEKLDKTKILIILAMTYLSVTHIRHQSFFILAVGTLLYDEIYSIINSCISKLKERFNLKNTDKIVIAKEIIVYIAIMIIALPPLFKEKQVKITDSHFPRFAIEFLRINNIEGNLLTSFNWGSYASYKLYPHNLIYMDGRYEEVYDPKMLIDLQNFCQLKENWDKIIKEYKTDIIIIEVGCPVYDKLNDENEWTLVFGNNVAGVFIPTKDLKEKYLYPTPYDEYYNNTVFKTDIKF